MSTFNKVLSDPLILPLWKAAKITTYVALGLFLLVAVIRYFGGNI
jgi:hypothetical protein